MGIAEIDARRHAEMMEHLFRDLKKEFVKQCTICNGSGLLSSLYWDEEDEIIPMTRTTTCSCKVKVLEKIALFEAGVPREFWSADKIKPSFNIDQFAILHMYSQQIENAKKHGLSLLLHGENGTGKSSSASIAAIAALKKGMTVAFISWPDLVQGWKRFKDPELIEALDERLSRDLIILDELGKEQAPKDSGDLYARFDSLLRMRRGAFMPTIIVSNFGPADIVDRYGESIGSLLSDRFKVMQYEPGDYRTEIGPNWNSLLNGGGK